MNYDVSEDLRAYESGELEDAAIVRLYQHLADTGQVWEMEGHYSKTALELAESGRITLPDFGLDTTYFFGP
ncbi:MAG: hypothetical protein AAEJ52_06385 [Myxococcota bacterium]